MSEVYDFSSIPKDLKKKYKKQIKENLERKTKIHSYEILLETKQQEFLDSYSELEYLFYFYKSNIIVYSQNILKNQPTLIKDLKYSSNFFDDNFTNLPPNTFDDLVNVKFIIKIQYNFTIFNSEQK